MPLSQRILLVLGSALTLVYFVNAIRKNKMKITYSIFWAVFGIILLVMACIPKAVYRVSDMLGFVSSANFVYVVVISLLVFKLFTTTLRLSKLSEQVNALTQELALSKLAEEEKDKTYQE